MFPPLFAVRLRVTRCPAGSWPSSSPVGRAGWVAFKFDAFCFPAGALPCRFDTADFALGPRERLDTSTCSSEVDDIAVGALGAVVTEDVV
jgi:hypothetical protein